MLLLLPHPVVVSVLKAVNRLRVLYFVGEAIPLSDDAHIETVLPRVEPNVFHEEDIHSLVLLVVRHRYC